MMADLGIAEIRAEGRRLAEAIGPEAYDRYIDYLYDNADVLLADPAPVGLTEKERELVERHREAYPGAGIIAIIDRLSAAPVDDRERVPEGWRVEWHQPLYTKPLRPRLVPVSPSVDPEEG